MEPDHDCDGLGSSSEPVAFFGMGQDAIASRIDIRWTSGAVQTLERVSADRYLTIEESAALPARGLR